MELVLLYYTAVMILWFIGFVLSFQIAGGSDEVAWLLMLAIWAPVWPVAYMVATIIIVRNLVMYRERR